MEFLHHTEYVPILETADYRAHAAFYLKEGGLTEAEITALLALITEE